MRYVSPVSPADPAESRARRSIRIEITVVLSVTFGLAGLRSALRLVEAALTRPLAEQSVALNRPRSAVSLLDLAWQVSFVVQLAAWAGLALYLLVRAGHGLRSIGLDGRRPGRDTAAAVGLAVLIGVPGLVVHVVAVRLGINLTVIPSTLDYTWWRVPALVASAVANGVAEEIVVVAYLITRLRDLGVRPAAAIGASALLRGAYHLYQGVGGGLGNVVMGLVFGALWWRTRRLWPLVVAHALIDIVAFVGYALVGSRLPLL